MVLLSASWSCSALVPVETIARRVFGAYGERRSISGVYGGEADPMPMMEMFDRGIQLRMGQCHVKRWIDDILPLVTGDDDPLGARTLGELCCRRVYGEGGARETTFAAGFAAVAGGLSGSSPASLNAFLFQYSTAVDRWNGAEQPRGLVALAVIGIALVEVFLRDAVERREDDVRPHVALVLGVDCRQIQFIHDVGYETGQVILEGKASELAGNDLVRQAYLGG